MSMATTATDPAERPAEREYVVTVCQPPDWTAEETAAALAELAGRLQDAAGMYRGPGWQGLPAPRVRPLGPAGVG